MKIERLHSGLVQAVEQISILRRAAESRDADLRAHLDQATGELRAATAALKLRMDTADLGAERTAARGVMLIGVGVILTSIPDGLARVAWIGWLAFAIALLLFGGVMLAVANELRAAASAHRTAQAPARPDWGSPGH